MHTLVIYDIPCDRIRHRVSETCKDYGLRRFQWSAFEGELSRSRREELFDQLDMLVRRAGAGKILILPVAARELENAMRVGLEPQAVEAAE